MTRKLLSLLLVTSLLSGCKSPKGKGDEEVLLSAKDQRAILSNAKLPQQYGFEVYPTPTGIAMRGDARLHPNQMATAHFKKDAVPVITVKGRSSRMKMNALIDPSSPTSWLELGKAREFKAVFLGIQGQHLRYHGGYNTGDADAYGAVITQLRIDKLFIENVPLYVRMALNSLGPLNRGIKSPKVDGVVGYDILRNFEYVRFNLAEDTVDFSASIPYTPHEDRLMSAAGIVDLPNSGFAVQGAIFGDETPILLDFAGDYSFARSDTNIATTAQVSLGEVVYLKVPTVLLPVRNLPPRAGRKMLEQYVVTICPNRRVVYFERPPE